MLIFCHIICVLFLSVSELFWRLSFVLSARFPVSPDRVTVIASHLEFCVQVFNYKIRHWRLAKCYTLKKIKTSGFIGSVALTKHADE